MNTKDFKVGEYSFVHIDDYSTLDDQTTNRIIGLKAIFAEHQQSMVNAIYHRPVLEDIVELGANPGYLIFLGDLLAGYSVYSHGVEYGRTVFHIDELYLERIHRGKGLGRACLEKMLEISRGIVVDQIFISAVSMNTPAIKLYESLGFQPLNTDMTIRC